MPTPHRRAGENGIMEPANEVEIAEERVTFLAVSVFSEMR